MMSERRNILTAWSLVSVIVGMVGLSFAAVPLYRLFCAATGFGGTPNISQAAAPGSSSETIRVRLNADTNPGLPWIFGPDQLEVSLNLGDEQIAFYRAVNKSDQPVTGMALYNVTPEKVGKYFHKTACFCFNKQTLAANQSMEFPVSFWVDPAIRDNPNTRDVKVITLSYIFFRSLDDAARTEALSNAGPHVGPLSAAQVEAQSKSN
jgi:cytochrome c oxidase assembly protein subunit 11